MNHVVPFGGRPRWTMTAVRLAVPISAFAGAEGELFGKIIAAAGIPKE